MADKTEKQPKPSAEADRIAALEAQVAQLLAAQAPSQQQLAQISTLEARVEKLQAVKAVAKEDPDQAWTDFKAWAHLSPEKRTQIAADKKWGTEEGQRWRVTLSQEGWPSIVVPAVDEAHATLRYNELCGIRGIASDPGREEVKHVVARVSDELLATAA
jgi:hypothetical protein